MGHFRDIATIVQSYDETRMREAHAKAVELFSVADPLAACLAPVTPLMPLPVNRHWAFAVLPSGSKAGWDHWEREQVAREAFKAFLHGMILDGRFIDWVELVVQEGGTDPQILEFNGAAHTETEEHYIRKKPAKSQGEQP